MQTPTRPRGLFRINVTPVIDVALTLVIILLLTAPMLSVPDVALDLPTARSRGNDENEAITVTLDREGRVGVDDRLVVRTEFVRILHDRLVREAKDNKEFEPMVVVRADAATPYSEVHALMEEARAAGAARLAVATRQPTLKEQP